MYQVLSQDRRGGSERSKKKKKKKKNRVHGVELDVYSPKTTDTAP